MTESIASSAEFDPHEAESVCASIVEAVGSAEGADPIELTPLQQYVDCDSLGDLVASMDHGDSVEFTYSGYAIEVEGDGRIEVRENDTLLASD